jgi:hypothetical protein
MAQNATSARATENPWQIVRVTGEVGTPIRQRAWLVTAANVLNELADKDDNSRHEFATQTSSGLTKRARLSQRFASTLASYAAPDGLILTVEPGVPRSAALLSEMRGACLAQGRPILAPCVHDAPCPMPGWTGRPRDGERGKWCNFGFSTQDAPKGLRAVSKDAGLPKDRATLAFLLAGGAGSKESPAKAQDTHTIDARVISDAMHLPGGRIGFYGCSSLGLTLVEAPGAQTGSVVSGSLVTVENRPLGIDGKSSAKRLGL